LCETTLALLELTNQPAETAAPAAALTA
jgi:hypothetical protein